MALSDSDSALSGKAESPLSCCSSRLLCESNVCTAGPGILRVRAPGTRLLCSNVAPKLAIPLNPLHSSVTPSCWDRIRFTKDSVQVMHFGSLFRKTCISKGTSCYLVVGGFTTFPRYRHSKLTHDGVDIPIGITTFVRNDLLRLSTPAGETWQLDGTSWKHIFKIILTRVPA